MYSSLPKELTIKQSKVQGLGLFALCDIAKGTNFGMSHLQVRDELIRTPLGGFINHSDNPNCEKVKLPLLPLYQKWNTTWFQFIKYSLITIQDIKVGEELTTKYTFYKLNEKL